MSIFVILLKLIYVSHYSLAYVSECKLVICKIDILKYFLHFPNLLDFFPVRKELKKLKKQHLR